MILASLIKQSNGVTTEIWIHMKKLETGKDLTENLSNKDRENQKQINLPELELFTIVVCVCVCVRL